MATPGPSLCRQSERGGFLVLLAILKATPFIAGNDQRPFINYVDERGGFDGYPRPARGQNLKAILFCHCVSNVYCFLQHSRNFSSKVCNDDQ